MALNDPANDGFDVTPSDSADLAIPTRGLYVGTAGDVKVTLNGGGTVTFKNLAAGVIHPVRAKRVFSTGTGALNIVGVT